MDLNLLQTVIVHHRTSLSVVKAYYKMTGFKKHRRCKAAIAGVAILVMFIYLQHIVAIPYRWPNFVLRREIKVPPQFPTVPVDVHVATRGIKPEQQRPEEPTSTQTEQQTAMEQSASNATTMQGVITNATKQSVPSTSCPEDPVSATTQKALRRTTTKKSASTQRPNKPVPKKSTPAKQIKPPQHPKTIGVLVNSSSCSLSDYDPWDATVANIVRKEKRFSGCRLNYPVKFEQKGNHLTVFVNRTLLKSDCEIECCYRAVKRNKEGESDDKFKFGNETICFDEKRPVVVNTEFVSIRCWCNNTNAVVYEDFRAFILTKPKKSSISNKAVIDNGDRLNVYMIAIDSVSRLNFKRQMPEVEAQLEELGAIPMSGLTKVGRNTLPNMLPFLAGMTIDEFKASYVRKPLDGLPVIWKDFSNIGYYTLYSEDQPSISTFNYLQEGFYHTPTDYYMRPLYRAMTKSKFIKNGASDCVNQRLHFNLQLHWLEDFIARPEPTPQFALVFSNSLSHQGPLSYVRPMQSRLKQFLQTYRNSDRFNSSILFLFSDHGMRHGSILHTELGGYEARLPFFYVLLPPWYSVRHPQRFANLQANSHRLTTFFDGHATLRTLLLDAGAAETDMPEFHHPGVSLFDPVPLERTCDDAGIAPHWCVCRARLPLSVTNSVVTRAASAVVRHINDVLLRQVRSQCAELTLSRVTAAFHTMSEGQAKQDSGKTRQAFEEVAVQILTQPGGGEFEATVRCWKGLPQNAAPKTINSKERASAGGNPAWLEEQCKPEHPMSAMDLSRMNLYKGQSDCLKEGFEERLYCYCKDLL